MDSGDLLFDDDAPPPGATMEAATTPFGPPDWLLEQLRRSLDQHGIADMDGRRKLVERLVHREVPSLRSLTTGEAQRLLADLHRLAQNRPNEQRRSAWDAREEETWIDRL